MKPQVVELAHGIGLQVDAHAQRLQIRHRLVDHAGHADLVQREGQGQAADAAAGDQHGELRAMGLCLGHGRILVRDGRDRLGTGL